jgi:TatD DNase family protein
LAPAPYRGKTNTPAYVPYVAKQLATLKNCSVQTIADVTSHNFDTLFLS